MDELIDRLLEPGVRIRVQGSIALPWFEGEQAQERHYQIIGKARLDAPRSRYFLHKWARYLAGDWCLLIDVLRDLAHCSRNPRPTLPWLAQRCGLSYTTLYRMIGAGGFYWSPTVKIQGRAVPVLEIPDLSVRRYHFLRWLGVRWYIPQIVETGRNSPYRIVPLMGDVLHPDQRPELWSLFDGLLRPDQGTLLDDAELPWQQFDFPGVPLHGGGADLHGGGAATSLAQRGRTELACPSTEEGQASTEEGRPSSVEGQKSDPHLIGTSCMAGHGHASHGMSFYPDTDSTDEEVREWWHSLARHMLRSFGIQAGKTARILAHDTGVEWSFQYLDWAPLVGKRWNPAIVANAIDGAARGIADHLYPPLEVHNWFQAHVREFELLHRRKIHAANGRVQSKRAASAPRPQTSVPLQPFRDTLISAAERISPSLRGLLADSTFAALEDQALVVQVPYDVNRRLLQKHQSAFDGALLEAHPTTCTSVQFVPATVKET